MISRAEAYREKPRREYRSGILLSIEADLPARFQNDRFGGSLRPNALGPLVRVLGDQGPGVSVDGDDLPGGEQFDGFRASSGPMVKLSPIGAARRRPTVPISFMS